MKPEKRVSLAIDLEVGNVGAGAARKVKRPYEKPEIRVITKEELEEALRTGRKPWACARPWVPEKKTAGDDSAGGAQS